MSTRVLMTAVAMGMASVLAGTGFAWAQSPRGALSDADHKLVLEAAEAGQMEVELGELAQQKASSDAVKQFGQRMANDREYVKTIVKDHEKDVAAFKRESQQAKDPDLKTWVTKTLPTLEDHLQAIKQIESQAARQ